jgi:hypothetical protein
MQDPGITGINLSRTILADLIYDSRFVDLGRYNHASSPKLGPHS